MSVYLINSGIANISRPVGKDMWWKFVLLMTVILFSVKEDTRKYADITMSSKDVNSGNGVILVTWRSI